MYDRWKYPYVNDTIKITNEEIANITRKKEVKKFWEKNNFLGDT